MYKIKFFTTFWSNEGKRIQSILDDISSSHNISYNTYDIDIYKDFVSQQAIRAVPTIIFLDESNNEVLRVDHDAVNLDKQKILEILSIEKTAPKPIEEVVAVVEEAASVVEEDEDPIVDSLGEDFEVDILEEILTPPSEPEHIEASDLDIVDEDFVSLEDKN